MSLNKLFQQQENNVSTDSEFLKTLRARLLEQQAATPSRQAWQWWTALATASVSLGVIMAVTFFSRSTPLAPQVAFAAAFENTFGSSLTDFFFTEEGRHMQWEITRSGQLEGAIDLWKINEHFRFRYADRITVYDSLHLSDQQCTYAADGAASGEISCQEINLLIQQDIDQLRRAFLHPTLTLEPTVVEATDTTYKVDGWVISWETAEPYVLTGGDTMESWAEVDGARIVYVEGPRAYGGQNIMDATNPNVFHSMFDVVNEPTDTGYRHAAFLAFSRSNLVHGLTFQIVENEAGSEVYYLTQDVGLTKIENLNQHLTRLAENAPHSLPIDSRMFEALYVARDMDAFTTPLETRTEEFVGRSVTYYRFSAPSNSGEFATSWKNIVLLDDPEQIFEFWVDEELGKIIKYRLSSTDTEAIEQGESSNEQRIDSWEATLLIDESYNQPLTYETWSEEVR